MLIIDFDDTLFDTTAFKHALQEAFMRAGVTKDAYDETYHAARIQTDKTWNYSPWYQEKLLERQGFDAAAITVEFEKLLAEDWSQWVLPGAQKLLQWFREHEHRIVIVTLGDKKFQQLKCEKSGIAQLVDEICFVSENKVTAMERLVQNASKDENIFFINDKPDETEIIAEIFTTCTCILRQKNGIEADQYVATDLPYYQTLDEIYSYVTRK